MFKTKKYEGIWLTTTAAKKGEIKEKYRWGAAEIDGNKQWCVLLES